MAQSKVRLNLSALLSIPFEVYPNDFSFIVNQEEFKTSHLISELLSPKICRMRSNDPTINSFLIDTESQGDFGEILDLISFNEKEITSNELPFLIEVLDNLENENITLISDDQNCELTKDNIFTFIKIHEKHQRLYKKSYQREIEFISSHFYELAPEQEEELMALNESTIKSILEHDKLNLLNEDQLLRFLNHIYEREPTYGYFYENVIFSNVSKDSICEFLDIFQIDDLTKTVWSSISNRLKQSIKLSANEFESSRYRFNTCISGSSLFLYDRKNEFSGIINFLKSKSEGNIDKEITITAAPLHTSYETDKPRIVTEFEEHNNKSYISTNSENSFICFKFNKCQVNLTNYTIRARKLYNCCYPRSWIVEGSNDNNQWDPLDERINCNIFNQNHIVHTFDIQNQNRFYYQFIRIRQIGPNSDGNHHFIINAFEMYGHII